ncbi:MAG: NUDIX domain-containing protein [Fimbriimonadaceae bacterium]|nr:NUDIX domain-containing protein [Fimbriimonadaceae bacterium]
MSNAKFPCGQYGRQKLEFYPAPFRSPLRAFAALVFPWHEEKVLLCNICDRGWCIPSGRVEPNESSLAAAEREAHEEAGAILSDLLYIGCYRITERCDVRWADVFTAHVEDLEELSPEFESIGRMYADVEELPDIYHLWNPLTEALFLHSRDILRRHRDCTKYLRDCSS